MKTFLLILLLAIPCAAQVKKDDFFKPYGRGFIASSAVYWGGSVFDTLNTRRCVNNGTCRELNPLFRTRDGKLRVGRAIASQAIGYGLTLWLEKKHPKLASFLRFGGGAAHVLGGSRNW
jgi:hypothetical protein